MTAREQCCLPGSTSLGTLGRMPEARSLTVVLPCYNEEANIRSTIDDVLAWFDAAGVPGTVVVVDDGSRDTSRDIVRQLASADSRVRLVPHDVNQGYGAAVRTGCDAAQTDLIAFMDSDGQFHAEDIGALLERMHSVDVVTGIRVRRADPWRRKLNARLYGALVRFRLGVRVRDINCGLKMFTREAWKVGRPTIATGALINGEMFYRWRRAGIRWDEVPVPHYPRRAGQQTGAKLSVILRMFTELNQLKRALP